MTAEFVTRVPTPVSGGKNLKGRFVNLLVDGNFKLIFSKKKNKPILIELLDEFVDAGIRDITLVQQEQKGDRKELKAGVFDLYAKTDDGRSIVVEVQFNSRGDYLDRMLYYSTWPLKEQKLEVEKKGLLVNKLQRGDAVFLGGDECFGRLAVANNGRDDYGISEEYRTEFESVSGV